jgi:uncharacterized alkaline shock family protein YloU
MSQEHNPIGSIHVSPRAIATIAYQAAVQSYGVVGLAAKNFFKGIHQLVDKDASHGVFVDYDDDHINIDMYVIVEYGTNISSVSASVAKTVRFHVEKALGLPINEVNVHVQGLRVSDSK